MLESDRDYNYKKSRDQVADSQWAQEFALQKKTAASSDGSYSENNGYLGPNSSSSEETDFEEIYNKAKNKKNSSINSAIKAVVNAAKKSAKAKK